MSPKRYAEGTAATVANSQAEIHRTLERFGVENVTDTIAKGRHRDTDQTVEVWRLHFEYDGRQVRFDMDALDGSRQQVRERYRALLLHIKSQCVAVTSGFLKPEHAFLMDTLVPVERNGFVEVVPASEIVGPMLEHAYRTGVPLPPLLPNRTRD